MRKYVGVMIFICIVLFLLPLPRCGAIEVKVGIYQNEPLIFADNTGTAKGIFADILEYIAFKEEWTIQYLAGTFQQGLERLKTGEIDILCTIAYSKERDKWFDFSRDNLLTNWGQIFTKNSSDIRTIIDLDNKKV